MIEALDQSEDVWTLPSKVCTFEGTNVPSKVPSKVPVGKMSGVGGSIFNFTY
jgi:hypothetical protein